MKISFLLELVGYANAALGVAMLMMRTMIPLRIAGILHNVVSVVFGAFAGVYPMLVQHSILLPLNSYRLHEMRKLVRSVKEAAAADHSMEWIKPFTTKRNVKAGQIMFRKGDVADRMFFVMSGNFIVRELGITLGNGAVVGELAFLAPDRKRTQTLECLQSGEVLEVDYEKLEELYYQNPTFGFYFLQLTSARLFDNIDRLRRELHDREIVIASLRDELATVKAG
ncbi:MAG TPA: cyclic nucleotide-binding domain-containing protein [Pseudorhodoplanes sp.]|nr:cyclic nucleotide-binding domain-containing protein [Pseudorhodoplanes sp.]